MKSPLQTAARFLEIAFGELAWSPGFSRSEPPEGGTPCKALRFMVARDSGKQFFNYRTSTALGLCKYQP